MDFILKKSEAACLSHAHRNPPKKTDWTAVIVKHAGGWELCQIVYNVHGMGKQLRHTCKIRTDSGGPIRNTSLFMNPRNILTFLTLVRTERQTASTNNVQHAGLFIDIQTCSESLSRDNYLTEHGEGFFFSTFLNSCDGLCAAPKGLKRGSPVLSRKIKMKENRKAFQVVHNALSSLDSGKPAPSFFPQQLTSSTTRSLTSHCTHFHLFPRMTPPPLIHPSNSLPDWFSQQPDYFFCIYIYCSFRQANALRKENTQKAICRPRCDVPRPAMCVIAWEKRWTKKI